MKEFIEYLVKEIVSKPDEVVVDEIEDNGFFTYRITTHEEDMGMVIGKSGNNIRALRNLAKAKAIKDKVRIKIVVEDDEPINED